MKISQRDRIEAQKVVEEFKKEKTDKEIFYNLCFAIMAPQTTFINNRKATAKLIEHDFYSKNIDDYLLYDLIRKTRFYRQKTDRLSRAKKQFQDILECLRTDASSFDKREYLVKNVKGLGMKAASHLLRNMGCTDLAIIDTHVLKFLREETPKNKKEYIEMEKTFNSKARDRDLSPAELDAIIWKQYSNTDWNNFIY